MAYGVRSGNLRGFILWRKRYTHCAVSGRYGLKIRPILRCGFFSLSVWRCAVDRVACLEVGAADIRFGRFKQCTGLFLLLRIEIACAKEDRIYVYLQRKTSRLLIPDNIRNCAGNGLQCGLFFKAIKSRSGRPAGVSFKGKPPFIRRRGAGNGEIQLDLKPQDLLSLPPSLNYN